MGDIYFQDGLNDQLVVMLFSSMATYTHKISYIQSLAIQDFLMMLCHSNSLKETPSYLLYFPIISKHNIRTTLSLPLLNTY